MVKGTEIDFTSTITQKISNKTSNFPKTNINSISLNFSQKISNKQKNSFISKFKKNDLKKRNKRYQNQIKLYFEDIIIFTQLSSINNYYISFSFVNILK